LFFERFALHHVAPMTSRIPDAEKYRLIFRASLGESFIPPGIPIDRVMLVLKQIRRFLPREAVRVAMDSGWIRHNFSLLTFGGVAAAGGHGDHHSRPEDFSPPG